MKISVIMPLYNMEVKVERTLQHFVEQNTDDIEIIIVDDCSTDSTNKIVASYIGVLPIKLICLNNKVSVGRARNIGIEHSLGEYLFFCDGDDLMFCDNVRNIINRMEEKDIPLSIAEYQEYDWEEDRVFERTKGIRWDIVRSGEIVDSGDYISDIFQLTNITCWNKIFNSSFIKSNKIKFPDTNYLEDLVFVYEGLLKASKVLVAKEICYCYSVPSNARSSMLTTMDDSLEEYMNTLEIMNDILFDFFETKNRVEIENISKSAIYEYIRLISFARKKSNGKWNSKLDAKAFDVIVKLQEKNRIKNIH